MASRNAPSLNGPSSPFTTRVPSGNTITETLRSSHTAHSAMAFLALSLSPRSTLMSPAIDIICPAIGMRNMLSLDSHFISQGRWLMRRMSANDSWLQTAM